jgi:K+:H+ antiporter
MNSILVIIVISLALASVINIVLSKLSVSHIIGYIITGILVSSLFSFDGDSGLHSLDLIGEFGIVFLMFTIGLEMSFARLDKMKTLIFVNGSMQVIVSSLVIFLENGSGR